MFTNRHRGNLTALAVLIVLALPACPPVQADDAYWVGGSGYWDDAAKWDPNYSGVPSGDFGVQYTCFIDAPSSIAVVRQDVSVYSVYASQHLRVVNGASLTVENLLQIDGSGRFSGSGTVQALNTNIQAELFATGYGSSLTLRSENVTNSGSIYATNYGVLTIAADFTHNTAGRIFANGEGEVRFVDADVNGNNVEADSTGYILLLEDTSLLNNVVTVRAGGGLEVENGEGPTQHESEIDHLDNLGEVTVVPGARLRLGHLDQSDVAGFVLRGTAWCSGGTWAGPVSGGAQLHLEGGRIDGNFTNELGIVGHGQIAARESDGGLVQKGPVSVSGGVLELTPKTKVTAWGNMTVAEDGELFLNAAKLAGVGGPGLSVQGTLRLLDASITGMSVNVAGGGGGLGALSGVAGPGGALIANGTNDLTDANVYVHLEQGSAADIQSGVTRFRDLSNDGLIDVRAGARMTMTGDYTLAVGGTGAIDVAGVLECNAPTGSVVNDGRINVLPGGVMNLYRTGVVGSGSIHVAGTLNADLGLDASGGGGSPGIVLEGGLLAGATTIERDISGYGTITGTHYIARASIYNEQPGRELLITNALMMIDGNSANQLRADCGGKVRIENSLIGYGEAEEALFVVQNRNLTFSEPNQHAPLLSEMSIRNSIFSINGRVGPGGILATSGTTLLGEVDVRGGGMIVSGDTRAMTVTTGSVDANLPFGGMVMVQPGQKLTVQHLLNDGEVDLTGELHFTERDVGSFCSISGSGHVYLASGSITGEVQVTHSGTGDIQGDGRISVPLINYGNIRANFPGSWLRLDTNDKVNYGLIRAENPGWGTEGGKIAIDGIRLDNYGTIQVDPNSELLVKAGTIDTKDPNGHIYNAGRITVESGGTINLGTTQGGSSNTNNGEIFVASGGALNLTRTSLEGSGYVRVAGALNADDVEIPGSGGGGAGIVMEGGLLGGALDTSRDIRGYGTITGNHHIQGASLYNETSGQTLFITNASILMDGNIANQLRADYGGRIRIENALVTSHSEPNSSEPILVVQNQDFPPWDPNHGPPPPDSEAWVHDSVLVMQSRIGAGGFLLTTGTVYIGGVDVHGGMMLVLGDVIVPRLTTLTMDPSGKDEDDGMVVVGPTNRLTLGALQNDGEMEVEGELCVSPLQGTDGSLGGTSPLRLWEGRITGQCDVTHTGTIQGHGVISAPMVNYGSILASTAGGWLRLDTNDKVNYGLIRAEKGKIAVDGIRLDNYGLILIDPNSHLLVDGGIIDNKDPNALTQVDGTLEIRHGGAIYGGHVIINGAQDHFGPALLSLRSGGKAEVNTDAGRADRFELTVSADGPGAEVNFGATQHLAGLDLSAGGRAKMTTGGSKVLVTRALGIDANDSRLDLTDNDAIVDYEPGSDPFNQISAWIAQGFNGGDWLGNGITSTETADPNYGGLAGIGFADKAAGLTEFSGQTVDDSCVLVKFTWYGDADLNGAVNTDDFGLWVAGFSGDPGTSQTWLYGDFDYNGAVNTDDFALWAYAFEGQTRVLSEGFGGAAVPEPGTMALLGLGAIGLVSRRRARPVS